MYGKLDFLHAAFGIVPANLDNYESTLDSPAFDLNGIDGQFLLERVTQEDFYLRNGMIANGSRKAKRIHEDTFLNMDFMVPSLNEQKQIGDFFRRLNNLITLHQNTLSPFIRISALSHQGAEIFLWLYLGNSVSWGIASKSAMKTCLMAS